MNSARLLLAGSFLLLLATLAVAQNAPVSITSTSPLPSGVVGAPYYQTLVATGGFLPRTWSVVSGTLPPPLTLSASGTLSGTPTTAGAYRFIARVTDAVGSFDTRTFDLTIAQNGTTQGPDGQVGVAYRATLVALSGTGPWTWAITSGQLPPGLGLNSTTGVISGLPTTAGTFSFVAQWTDSQGLIFPNTFAINILPLLVITTTSLPPGTVGVAYSQTLAATGGILPYTWSVSNGALPPGLTLSAGGTLSGTPTQAGSYTFTVTVNAIASMPLTLTMNPAPLAITTASPLPNGTAGTAYSQTLAATGGVLPYTWAVTAGALPAGLTLTTAGLLSGTPTQGGSYTFTVTVNAAVSKQFTLVVSVPPAPTLSVTGLTDTVNPAQQPTFDVQLSATYSLPISGTITLAFTPDAVNPADDPAIQFSTGGRTLSFAIAAGQTHAFPTSPSSLQTGTVAGRIDLTARFSAGGQDITPSPAPVRSIQIARSAPGITSVQVVMTSGGFNVLVTGYSTPRQVTQAMFGFTAAAGKNLQTTQVPVSVDSAFTTWYSGASSSQYGSTFVYTQPFLVQGDVSAIASVSVTLTNSVGTSQSGSATF